MTSEGFREMFECIFADMCGNNNNCSSRWGKSETIKLAQMGSEDPPPGMSKIALLLSTVINNNNKCCLCLFETIKLVCLKKYMIFKSTVMNKWAVQLL